MFRRVLTVCIGNICRSPTAEYLLRDALAGRDIQVESAGLGAMIGQPMDPTALDVLAGYGVDGQAHVARQLTRELLRQADLVLGMEKSHVAAISRLAPEATGKIFLMDRWGEQCDIPDPYRQERAAFVHVGDMLEQAAAAWLRYL